MLLEQDDVYMEMYFDYRAEVQLVVKELQDAIEANTEFLNDGEAWVKLQYIATELDDLKGILWKSY